MRISSVSALILLGACGQTQTDRQTHPQVETAHGRPVEDSAALDCAIAGAGAFEPECTLDRDNTARGMVLTARHPDGGFRRLLVTKDGRGVVAADGAEPARVRIVGNGEIEVSVGEDRYRLPATIRDGAAPSP